MTTTFNAAATKTVGVNATLCKSSHQVASRESAERRKGHSLWCSKHALDVERLLAGAADHIRDQTVGCGLSDICTSAFIRVVALIEGAAT